MKLRKNSQPKSIAMLFEGGRNVPPITKFLQMNQTIEMIMEQADIYGLRGEVRATAMAIIKEDPTINTGSAYAQAAYEWDIF